MGDEMPDVGTMGGNNPNYANLNPAQISNTGDSFFSNLGNIITHGLSTYIDVETQIALSNAHTPVIQKTYPQPAINVGQQGLQISSGMIMMVMLGIGVFLIAKD